MKNKLLIIIIILLIIIIAILAFVLLGNKKSGTNNPNTNNEEQTNNVSDEYITRAALGRLGGDEEFNPSKVTPTSTFSTTDQFCMILDIQKTIPAGVLGISVYDKNKNQDVNPKANFPQELKKGNTIGCESMQYPKGQYEQRFYINDVLVVALPFEVK